ncbi:hypothetical protein ABTY20_18900 [Streptomyces sp. NPDC126497]|uniref:hypothetical protein n=1 Tax=Streptomyces sp. NPDC126497 TaxID=3155313 RepID=UPI00331E9DAA
MQQNECPECEHAAHGVENGMQADECEESWCSCGSMARDAAWLVHNGPTATA